MRAKPLNILYIINLFRELVSRMFSNLLELRPFGRLGLLDRETARDRAGGHLFDHEPNGCRSRTSYTTCSTPTASASRSTSAVAGG